MLQDALHSFAKTKCGPVRHPAAVDIQPDYQALIELLERLYYMPDGLGETVLSPEEAAAVRRCGFAARAGCRWYCPPLPNELVSCNPLLHHLSDAMDPLNRPAGWKLKRAASPLIKRFHPMWRIELMILAKLRKEPGYQTKRRLQQQMWRYPASFFNRTLSRMIREDKITYYGGYLFPFGRQRFAEIVQPQLQATKQ